MTSEGENDGGDDRPADLDHVTTTELGHVTAQTNGAAPHHDVKSAELDDMMTEAECVTPETAVVTSEARSGWVIVAISFFLHMLTVGTLFSLGVLYVSWLQEFGESKGLTSWVVSLGMLLLSSTGPVPARLIARFGYGVVLIAGGVISCAGFCFSSLVTSVPWLIVTLGVGGGVGFGFIYLPAVTMVAEYFSKRRAVAYGIATAGVGIGGFVLSPFINWLEFEYGWRGTVLIMGGILLNFSVCGMLIRLIPPPKIAKAISIDVIINQNEMSEEERQALVGDDAVEKQSDTSCVKYSDTVKTAGYQDDGDGGDKESSSIKDPTASREHCPVIIKVVDTTCGAENSPEYSSPSPYPEKRQQGHTNALLSRLLKSFPEHRDGAPLGGSMRHIPAKSSMSQDTARQFSSQAELGKTPNHANKPRLGVPRSASSGIPKIFRDADWLLAGSVHSLYLIGKDEKRRADLEEERTRLIPAEESHPLVEGGDDPEAADNKLACSKGSLKMSQDSLKIGWRGRFMIILRGWIKFFSLLRDPTFQFLALSNGLTSLSFFMPVLYMVDRAVYHGIDKTSAAMLLSINGVGNVFGRFIIAALADVPWIDCVVLDAVNLSLCGTGTCLSAFCGSSYALHAVYAAFFGFTMGGYVSLAPVVTVELMGVARVGQAYGILLIFIGLAGGLGPPLAGFVFDLTGDFTVSFILHGFAVVLAAMALVPIIYWRQWRDKRAL